MENEEDFALDDVAAHAEARRGARRASARRGQRSAARSSQRAAAALPMDAGEGELRSWAQDLRADGFDLREMGGELVLQRGEVPVGLSTPGSAGGRMRKGPKRTRPAALAAAEQQGFVDQGTSSSRSTDHSAAAVNAAATAADGGREDRHHLLHLAVVREFDTAVWQGLRPEPRPVSPHSRDDSRLAGSAAGAAWYAAPTGAAGSSMTASAGATAAEPSQAAVQGPRDPRVDLLAFRDPLLLFRGVSDCFPAWAANGYWLLHQQRPGAVAAPGPGEAALALKGAALAARRAGYTGARMQALVSCTAAAQRDGWQSCCHCVGACAQ